MTGNLDWKWIGIGVLIMLALSTLAGLVAGLFLAPDLASASDAPDIELTVGQLVLLAIANFLVFAIGGFIVGVKSSGRTVWEPGISAAIAVLLALLLFGSFSVANLIASGLVPFGAGVLGGWLGERRQGSPVPGDRRS
ncbi:MAG TPA: hypothetical protein VF210_04910 [Pseudomonadales bacterium]